MDTEKWKPWPGYENIAEVSNYGRARTVDRPIEQKSSLGNTYIRIKKGALLALVDNGTGYHQVRIVVNGKTVREYIHRLVGMLFLNGYSPHLEIDHIDENKCNNTYTNLKWVTRKYNMEKCHVSNPHLIRNLLNSKSLGQ